MPKDMPEIEYSKKFLRQFEKLPLKVRKQTLKRIEDFRIGRNLPRLHDHQLKGEYADYRSINITGDVRALYYRQEDGVVVIFAFIGTHARLYR